MPEVNDDLGNLVRLPTRVRTVVSLVPSLTESLAVTDPGLIIGATRYCTHPPDLGVERVGGTKNPDTERIIALAPDLVVANEEENREEDLAALRDGGLAVWVTWVRGLNQALRSLDRMITVACGLDRPAWLDASAAAWQADNAELGDGASVSGLAPVGGVSADSSVRAIIPIWRRPWMVLGRDTFAADLLGRVGVENVYGSHPQRYPKVGIAELLESGADLVVLPDEPYRFTATDGPEAFGGLPAALVSGRHLTWYGPSLAEAPGELRRQLSPDAWLGQPDRLA